MSMLYSEGSTTGQDLFEEVGRQRQMFIIDRPSTHVAYPLAAASLSIIASADYTKWRSH